MLSIIFWLFVLLIFHSYIFFPLLLKILAKNKKNNTFVWDDTDRENLPMISVVMAAYNEQQVIEEKINSIFKTNYPLDKIEVLIGSDNSSDNTNLIISTYAEEYKQIKLFAFTQRQGKANIINQLAEKAQGEILILTDANVYFTESTLYHLVKHFRNNTISLVGGLILNTNLKKNGISIQEKTYLTNENILKYREGVLWGSMIGAFGGIYAIRKNAYHPVPLNFYMDDFYITLHVLQDGGKAIQELEAICYEDISNLMKEEFRRKIRISIGNFQNLSVFWKIALSLNKGNGFCFFSHKILRWFTPFMLIDCFIISLLLFNQSSIFEYLLYMQLILFSIPLFDYLLKKINIHSVLLRFITHFLSMNLALLIGFFRFFKGVESNVWQPTKRNQ
ncbi:MAG: glycosyltransferase [Bacteroidales bacterium]|nr:glycosyltransferase [Bacteroidales bacterium]